MYNVPVPHRYSIAEARSRLPAIVDQAEAGLDVELTRRGRPVAIVVSHRELARLRGQRRHFSDLYRTFLKKHAPEAIGLEDNELATRDKSPGRKVVL